MAARRPGFGRSRPRFGPRRSIKRDALGRFARVGGSLKRHGRRAKYAAKLGPSGLNRIRKARRHGKVRASVNRMMATGTMDRRMRRLNRGKRRFA